MLRRVRRRAGRPETSPAARCQTFWIEHNLNGRTANEIVGPRIVVAIYDWAGESLSKKEGASHYRRVHTILVRCEDHR